LGGVTKKREGKRKLGQNKREVAGGRQARNQSGMKLKLDVEEQPPAHDRT
jgi:hypothetical protein